MTGTQDNVFARLFDRAEWMDDAACRGIGVDTFYSTNPIDAQHARDMCSTCPVATQCADYSTDEYYGVWAGTNARDRQRQRGRKQGDRATRYVKCGTEAGHRRHLRNDETCDMCRWAYNDAYRTRKAHKDNEDAA